MDDLQAMDVAATGLAERLQQVPIIQSDTPSSCAGWSVYELINHVNGGGHRYLLLLHGADADTLTATRTQDHVGPDPAVSFWRWQEPLAEEFAAEGALTRTVHHPVGDRSGRDLLGMRVLDLTLHAWDLARSLQLNEDLDLDLVHHLLGHHMSLVEELRGHRLYAPARASTSPNPQQELLRRTGRG